MEKIRWLYYLFYWIKEEKKYYNVLPLSPATPVAIGV